MKIGILGAGAIGSNVGGHLKKGGAEVWFIDPNKAWMDSCKEKGLTWIDMTTGESAEPIFLDGCVTEPAECGVCDVVIVLTKTVYTVSAMQGAAPLIGENTVLLSFQNGYGNVDVLSKYVPRERIGYGVAKCAGTVLGDGKAIAFTVPKDNLVFTSCSGIKLEPFARLEEYLNLGDMPSRYTDDIGYDFWMKLGVNCVLNMPCGLLRINMYDFINSPQCRPIIEGIVNECVAVAHAEGCKTVTYKTLMKQIYAGNDPNNPPFKKHYPSGAQDILAKRIPEVDYLNGGVAKLGKKYGIPTPYNSTIAELVNAMVELYPNQHSE